jgi:hypothetical protein
MVPVPVGLHVLNLGAHLFSRRRFETEAEMAALARHDGSDVPKKRIIAHTGRRIVSTSGSICHVQRRPLS